MTTTRTRRTGAAAVALIVSLSLAGCAQGGGAAGSDYPTRQVQVTVPYAAGGGTDLAARALTDALEDELGKPVVIVNEEGGGGTVAIAKNARGASDGYSLSVAIDSNLTLQPSLLGDLDYDYKSFRSIQFAIAPLILVAAADAPYDDLTGLVDAAQAAPGDIRISTPGDGSSNDMAARALGIATSSDFTMVPFTSGGADAVNAVLSGEVELAATTVAVTRGLVEAGRLKVVGALSGEDAVGAEDSQNFTEAGIDDSLAIESMVYLNVPTGAQDAVVSTLQDAVAAAVEDESLVSTADQLGYRLRYEPPSDTAEDLAARQAVYQQILEQSPSLVKP